MVLVLPKRDERVGNGFFFFIMRAGMRGAYTHRYGKLGVVPDDDSVLYLVLNLALNRGLTLYQPLDNVLSAGLFTGVFTFEEVIVDARQLPLRQILRGAAGSVMRVRLA